CMDARKLQTHSTCVIPPDRIMIIATGSLKLLPRRMVDGRHHPIDVFLESLALAQGHKSIAIILSGTGSDGTLGLDEIKAAGGITFAQDESAAYEGMPRSAIMAGTVDIRPPPADQAPETRKNPPHSHLRPGATPATIPPR